MCNAIMYNYGLLLMNHLVPRPHWMSLYCPMALFHGLYIVNRGVIHGLYIGCHCIVSLFLAMWARYGIFADWGPWLCIIHLKYHPFFSSSPSPWTPHPLYFLFLPNLLLISLSLLCVINENDSCVCDAGIIFFYKMGCGVTNTGIIFFYKMGCGVTNTFPVL